MNKLFRFKKFIEKNTNTFISILVFLILSFVVLLYIYPSIAFYVIGIVCIALFINTRITEGKFKYKLKYVPHINEFIIAKHNYTHKDSSVDFKIVKGYKYRVWGLSDNTIYLEDQYKNIFYIDHLEYEDNFFSVKNSRNLKLDKILS